MEEVKEKKEVDWQKETAAFLKKSMEELFMIQPNPQMADGPVTIPIPADPFLLCQSVLAKGIQAEFEVFAPRKTFQLKPVLCPTHKRGSEHEFYGACISGVQRFDFPMTAQFARGARLLVHFGPYLRPDTQYDLVSLTAEVEEGVAGIRTVRNPDTGEGERFDFKAPPLAQFKTMALPQGGGWFAPYRKRVDMKDASSESSVESAIKSLYRLPPGDVKRLIDTEYALVSGYTVDKRKYRIVFDNEMEHSVTIRLEPKGENG